jgi:histidinol-phosphate/aromatic aminotransferase/cobyric acid decarboxylase-like protein
VSVNPRNVHNILRLHLNEPWNVLPDAISAYPDCSPLAVEIAGWLGVPPACVLATAGADQAIEAVVRAVGGPVIVIDPDFPRYAQHAEHCRLDLIKVPVLANGASFPADEVRAAADRAKLLIVGAIGNPTGYALPDKYLDELHEAFPALAICVDDCYAPLTGIAHHAWAAQTPNVVAVGSLSKIGFPGLRIGFLIARPELIDRIRQYISPFAISGLSLQVALGLFRDHAFPALVASCIDRQIVARDYLSRELEQRGFEIARPGGNWIMAKFGPGAPKLAEEIKRRCVLVQAPPHAALAEWLRVSTPNLEAAIEFVRVLDEVLAGAILADEGLFRLRDEYREADCWISAPFVFRIGGRVYEIDHIAVTMRDADQHRVFLTRLRANGAEVVEGPGVWPDDFCADPAAVHHDLSMLFATAKVPGGLLVAAAPNRPGDQLDRWRNDRGGDAVHHVAILADDFGRAAGELAADGWLPMTAAPISDGALAQWFLRNKSGQIIELIARPVGGDATFSCGNIALLRAAEVRK